MTGDQPDHRPLQPDVAETVFERERKLPFLLAGSGLGVITVLLLAAILLFPQITTAAVPVPDEQSIDAGFAQDMSVHHQQAVEMSLLVRDRTEDADVRRLAYDIINTQANQRGMMLGWLELWGLPKTAPHAPMAWMTSPSGQPHSPMPAPPGDAPMPGMATDTQIGRLTNASGKQAEILYLRLMINHHQSGITMAQAAVANAETEPVRQLARAMVDSQQAEIRLMTRMLEQRGARS